MRISVIIPSRKRVWGLVTALKSLRTHESGKHKITYTVGCDSDDMATRVFCDTFKEFPICAYVGEGRPETLGGFVNLVSTFIEADIHTALTDDLICTTYAWDDILAKAAEETPHGVFFWENALPSHQALWVAVTDKWYKAAGGIFAAHYPYWFDDLHMAEQWILATNTPCITPGIKCTDKPYATLRMRELPFWVDFFVKTRKLRVQKGKEIAAKLGLPEPKASEEAAKIIEEYIGVKDPKILTDIEKQGEKTPPDPAYLRAKAKATALLKTLEDTHGNTGATQ